MHFFIVFFFKISLSSVQWSLARIDKMSKLLSKDNLMKKIYADYQWLASYIENMCYKDEGYRGREEESATLQPAVTLMTPFITMCRLTSWQRHAAPDGGEGHSTIPTLCSSFLDWHLEGSSKEKERPVVMLVHSLTDTALAQLCKAVLVLVLLQQVA